MLKTGIRPPSYDDIVALPKNIVGELLNGSLETHPRPGPRHARAASVLGAVMLSHFDRSSVNGPGGWWILHEPECHLGDDVIVPDIAGWRTATMAALPDTAWFDVRPDWACEVVSPSTERVDRTVKRDIYAREGVAHYWIVDPVARLIEVFALTDDGWALRTTVHDEIEAALEPFESVPFALGSLWA